MGIDREQDHVVGIALRDHALDRDAGLSLVEYDRLVVEDAPAITHMRVHAIDAVRRRGSARACQAVLVVSSDTMSDDARSARPPR